MLRPHRRERPGSHRVASHGTERAGFEPATHLSARTRFPVALLRPLGHLSRGAPHYSTEPKEPAQGQFRGCADRKEPAPPSPAPSRRRSEKHLPPEDQSPADGPGGRSLRVRSPPRTRAEGADDHDHDRSRRGTAADDRDVARRRAGGHTRRPRSALREEPRPAASSGRSASTTASCSSSRTPTDRIWRLSWRAACAFEKLRAPAAARTGVDEQGAPWGRTRQPANSDSRPRDRGRGPSTQFTFRARSRATGRRLTRSPSCGASATSRASTG